MIIMGRLVVWWFQDHGYMHVTRTKCDCTVRLYRYDIAPPATLMVQDFYDTVYKMNYQPQTTAANY